MKNRNLRRNNSGQVLIIVSLIITLLILSTALYVIETEKDTATYAAKTEYALLAYKQGVIHTVISALSNITNGGDTDILITDLSQFKSVVTNNSFNAIFKMEFTLSNTTPYQNGVWINWDSNGRGISSACANFIFNSSGPSATYYSEYTVNVTSEITITGKYTMLNESLKQATVACTVFNENKPALAQNFTVYYEKDGAFPLEEWMQVAAPNITDYGNGTYVLSFTAETTNPGDPLIISVHCHDLRGIFVRANVTCAQV
ncbi:MAG: hypothetical protein QXP44_05225 [Candidatus Bathyarchaeia archaeon]